jgi:glycosyltransferase involved in cell wall biosynthesis
MAVSSTGSGADTRKLHSEDFPGDRTALPSHDVAVTLAPGMNIVLITPGAGGMYCGNCFRDNALAAALRKLGNDTLLVPLYLPLTLDEPDQSAGTPIFFGGINVYLDQKFSLFRRAPKWLHTLLSTPALLRWAAGRAAKTRPSEVGELTLSMVRGEEGNQARELADLIRWLRTQPKPDVICLSNALLVGLTRQLKRELRAPVICLLAGEDSFLDSLPESARDLTWKTLAERCAEIDLFLAPSRYFAELMTRRLCLRPERVRILSNGINVADYSAVESSNLERSRSDSKSLESTGPVLGYFARMCHEKGLGMLVDAYLLLKQRESMKPLRLHIGGSCGPTDEPFVEKQRAKLAAAGVLADVHFFPNVDHRGKIAFYRKVSVFSTPALYGEAFGLYVIEALAAGVPVVQPRHAAFPELIEATSGGVLCEAGDVKSLAGAIHGLVQDPVRARELGAQGRKVVLRDFSIERMAENFLRIAQTVSVSTGR